MILFITYFEKFSTFKTMLQIRLAISLSLIGVDVLKSSFIVTFRNCFVIWMTHVIYLNGVKYLNKLIRTAYIKTENKSKFLNQYYTVLDSIPYPVILFNPKQQQYENKGNNKMELVYFNLSADNIVKSKEMAVNQDTEEILLGFEGIIDPQD